MFSNIGDVMLNDESSTNETKNTLATTFFPTTHPSFLVKEGLPAKDGSEGALSELPVDDHPVPRDLPLVEGEEGGGRHEAQGPHPVLRLPHLHLVPKFHSLSSIKILLKL